MHCVGGNREIIAKPGEERDEFVPVSGECIFYTFSNAGATSKLLGSGHGKKRGVEKFKEWDDITCKEYYQSGKTENPWVVRE